MRSVYHNILGKAVKEYVEKVAVEIMNSIVSYVIEVDGEQYVYNLEVAKIRSYPIWECHGGETPPTEGCRKLISQPAVETQFSYRRKLHEKSRKVLREIEQQNYRRNRPVGEKHIYKALDQSIQKIDMEINLLKSKDLVEQTNRGLKFKPEKMKPAICPFCGGTEFKKYHSKKEFEGKTN